MFKTKLFICLFIGSYSLLAQKNPSHHSALNQSHSFLEPIDYQKDTIINWWKGLDRNHFIDVAEKNYRLVVDPVLDIRLGKDNNLTESTYRNVRGFQAWGNIKKFSFYTSLQENQTKTPEYINQKIKEQKNVFYGFGLPKINNKVYDLAQAQSYIAYDPDEHFHLEFGRGKHFIGDGYRSLLLMDNTAPYTYFKGTLSFWKIKYLFLFSQQFDYTSRFSDGTNTRRYNGTHYLSYQANDKLSIGLFETVNYHDTTRTRGIDINYINPIIFYRPIEIAIGSQGGNALLGLNLKYQIIKNGSIYFQSIFDEFHLENLKAQNGWWANKYAFQIGASYRFDKQFMDGNSMSGNILTEFNYARPFTFSHQIAAQSYGHANQPLGHTLGANFREFLIIGNINYKKWFAETKFVYYFQGKDYEPSISYGSDILKSYNSRAYDFDNETLQGDKATILYFDQKVGYTINPSYRLRVQVGATLRTESRTSGYELNTKYFYVGIVTDLFRTYETF